MKDLNKKDLAKDVDRPGEATEVAPGPADAFGGTLGEGPEESPKGKGGLQEGHFQVEELQEEDFQEADLQKEELQEEKSPADLARELAEKTALADEYLARLQRLQADFENFRRRVAKEREELLRYASENLICNLLPVLDNFERALAAGEGGNLLTGVEMIFRQLKDILEKEGLRPIEALHYEFDPARHEAVMQVESDEHPDNTVIEELQRGYLLKDKVIRPAMVKVAKN